MALKAIYLCSKKVHLSLGRIFIWVLMCIQVKFSGNVTLSLDLHAFTRPLLWKRYPLEPPHWLKFPWDMHRQGSPTHVLACTQCSPSLEGLISPLCVFCLPWMPSSEKKVREERRTGGCPVLHYLGERILPLVPLDFLRAPILFPVKWKPALAR